jgi:hypothetical protein
MSFIVFLHFLRSTFKAGSGPSPHTVRHHHLGGHCPLQGPPTNGRPRFATSAIWRESPDGSPVLLALPWLFRSLHTHFIKLQPSHTLEHVPSLVLAKQQWNVSEDCRLLEPYVQARSAAAAEEGAGVTAGFGAAVRGGSAVTTRTTPKIASPPPMSTTPVTGSDKITAPNTTATAGLT